MHEGNTLGRGLPRKILKDINVGVDELKAYL